MQDEELEPGTTESPDAAVLSFLSEKNAVSEAFPCVTLTVYSMSKVS